MLSSLLEKKDEFKVGDKVNGNFHMKGHFFPAVITAISAKSCTISYEGFLIGNVVYPCPFSDSEGREFTQDILIDVSGGGDLPAARAGAGFADAARFCSEYHICNKCEASKEDIKDNTLVHRQRSYVRSCHQAHMPAHPRDFPFNCPCCSFKAEKQDDVDRHMARYKGKEADKIHHKKHKGSGSGLGRTPAVCIEQRNYDDCVMHERKAITGMLLDETVLW
jgi:hypothetical protein